MNQKHKLRSLGSRWFNCQLCLFRIECRVVLLIDSHCIKGSWECNKDWITNNQYWSNWKKKLDSVGLWGRGKQEKPLGAKQRTNNKLNPHMASTLRDLNPTLLEGECSRTSALLALLPRILSLFIRSHINTHFLPFMHISKWFVS